MQNIIFIHGLESSGTGFKARLLREIFPNIHTPTFTESTPDTLMYDLLEVRMSELNTILNTKKKWIIIGSSFGGLMACLFTLNVPYKVIKLILLAPFLVSRKLKPIFYAPVDIPVIVYHGRNDRIVPYKQAQERATKFFTNLEYNIVDDDHSLHKTVKSLNWKKIILKS
jgi:alpha-beta hydrolase superfamily lysophospholipase